MWGVALKFLYENKWLAGLAIALLIIQSLGGVIVNSIAYFQPKVTVVTVTKTVTNVIDRSSKTIETTKLPDGTVRILEKMSNDIQSLTTSDTKDTQEREPVLAGSSKKRALFASYMPLDKRFNLGAGLVFDGLTIGAGHPIYLKAEDWKGIESFQPFIWTTYSF